MKIINFKFIFICLYFISFNFIFTMQNCKNYLMNIKSLKELSANFIFEKSINYYFCPNDIKCYLEIYKQIKNRKMPRDLEDLFIYIIPKAKYNDIIEALDIIDQLDYFLQKAAFYFKEHLARIGYFDRENFYLNPKLFLISRLVLFEGLGKIFKKELDNLEIYYTKKLQNKPNCSKYIYLLLIINVAKYNDINKAYSLILKLAENNTLEGYNFILTYYLSKNDIQNIRLTMDKIKKIDNNYAAKVFLHIVNLRPHIANDFISEKDYLSGIIKGYKKFTNIFDYFNLAKLFFIAKDFKNAKFYLDFVFKDIIISKNTHMANLVSNYCKKNNLDIPQEIIKICDSFKNIKQNIDKRLQYLDYIYSSELPQEIIKNFDHFEKIYQHIDKSLGYLDLYY